MTLMVIASVVAALCALGAGRAVPWQGKQAAVTMPLGMIALAIPAAGVPALLVAGLWVVSAMFGTIGLRGRPEAAGCCHRALGAVAMTLCLLAGFGHGVAAGGHDAHGVGGALPLLSGVAVLVVVVWSVVGMPNGRRGRAGLLLRAEVWAMTLGLIAMWLWHAVG